VRVAAGDVNGDGVLDVIAAQSFNGARVTAFSGSDFRTVLTTLTTGLALRGGVFVSAGDLDGDGKAEIVTGAGSGVGVVSVWRDRSAIDTKAVKVSSARPYGTFAGGVRVAVGDVDGDGRSDVAVAPGPAKERRLMLLGLNGPALDPLDELRTAEGAFYAGGLFVGAGRV
jgi:serralysin